MTERGDASDGALGLSAVKRHGGTTFAQLPGDARYESMPQAAIATGQVDRAPPVEEIPSAHLSKPPTIEQIRAAIARAP